MPRLAALILAALALLPGCSALPAPTPTPSPSRQPLTIAAVSCESRIRQVDFNLARIEHWSRRAREAGAQLVLFPESAIHCWWQSRENRQFAEPVDGPSIQRLITLARELDLILAVGMTELDGDRAYITHVIIDPATPTGILGTHRKSSLAGAPQGEALIWDAGSDANVFTIRGHRVGIAICFESVHPQTCAALRDAGAEIILAPYANGTRPDEITDPLRLQRRWVWDRVAETGAWYIACDATPHASDRSLEPGAAYAIRPDGSLAAITPADGPGEGMIIVTIPAEHLESVHRAP